MNGVSIVTSSNRVQRHLVSSDDRCIWLRVFDKRCFRFHRKHRLNEVQKVEEEQS